MRSASTRFSLYFLQFGGGLGGQARIVFLLLALQPEVAEIMPLARRIGLLLAPCVPARLAGRDVDHGNAIDRAGRDAQVAAGAQVGEHRMHLLRGAHDGVDRAGLYAKRTTYAQRFVNHRDRSRTFDAMHRVQWNDRFAENAGEARNTFRAAGRALVITRLAARHGLCIGTAGRIAAFRALRLRQGVFEAVSEAAWENGCIVLHKRHYPGKAVRLQTKKPFSLSAERLSLRAN